MEHKSSIAGVITATAVVAVVVLISLLIFCLSNAVEGFDERLDRIEKALVSPQIARTSVAHGYFIDQQNPKNSGLRMIRVARDGTLVVMPLAPPPPSSSEVKDDPSR